MEEHRKRYSIFALLLIISTVVLSSSYLVYKRDNQKPSFTSPLVSKTAPSVLGEQTSFTEADPKESPQQQPNSALSEESSQEDPKESNDESKKDNSSDSRDTGNNNVANSGELLLQLEKKGNLITKQVQQGNVVPEELFSPVLVDFFGDSEMQKVFAGVQEVTFTNYKILSNTEATSDCTLTENNLPTNHTCYFNLYENTWYLYKTALQ